MTQSCTMLKRHHRVFCGMCPLLIPGPSPRTLGVELHCLSMGYFQLNMTNGLKDQTC